MVRPSASYSPAHRRLRIFALDPSFGQKLDTSAIDELTIAVRWECGQDRASVLGPGPVGEYLEVVDVDPASGVFYEPVDLDNAGLLAQDGLKPTEGNPQFHQQMVYAVAMATIDHFERALGRVSMWASHRFADGRKEQFVRRLRIYPHALRDQNAYYSPNKKALLFGYFPVRSKTVDNTPGTLVFTCLSHDIIAHEVTHALLDGIHPRFNERTNPDVPAFHEAFADVVALFQHFAYPGLLYDQIRRTRGNLADESVLGQLAQQFGRATGRGSALRDALGEENPQTGRWTRRVPDANALERTLQPHARGAVLVAAIFGAFLLLYRARTADLYRIASAGTGVLPEGEIHPDLTRRLAEEAARTAQQILRMCIRAIDYCPPVDITFGDYLRAIVTGDRDLNPEDDASHQVAMIESFRQWGIHPHGILSMSVDSLKWEGTADILTAAEHAALSGGSREDAASREGQRASKASRRAPAGTAGFSAGESAALRGAGRDQITNLLHALHDPVATEYADEALSHAPLPFQRWDWTLESDRKTVWDRMRHHRRALWRWLVRGQGRILASSFGLVLDDGEAPLSVYRRDGEPTVEVHSVRPVQRRGERGRLRTDLAIEITQRRRGFFDRTMQMAVDQGFERVPPGDGDFKYRAGCTILVDLETAEIRRIIRTAGTVADDDELERVRRYLTGDTTVVGTGFDVDAPLSLTDRRIRDRHEPFALLHRHEEEASGRARRVNTPRTLGGQPAAPVGRR